MRRLSLLRTTALLCPALLLACWGKARRISDESGGSTPDYGGSDSSSNSPDELDDSAGGTKNNGSGGGGSEDGGATSSGGFVSGGSASGGSASGGASDVECEEKASRTLSCGTNDNGSQVQICTHGKWTDEGDCDNRFVSTWSVPSHSPFVILPLVENGNYDFRVDWGDGSLNHITAWDALNKKHVYSQGGSVTVTITGTFEGWSLGTAATDGTNFSQLVEISRFGPLVLGDTTAQFKAAHDLNITALDTPGLEHTTSLASAFESCGFSQASLAQWDVSTVTDMNQMFSLCSSFNEDIGSWDVSNVTNMASMFYQANNFNQDIGDWNVSNVTNMMSLFRNATSFNQNIGDWNVSNVTDMSTLFSTALSFNQDIGDWDVSNVTDMSAMFFVAEAFNQDIGNWDVSAVQDMAGMFLMAISFDQNIGRWDVSAVENFEGFFVPGTHFSTANYDQLLIGWSSLNLQQARLLQMGHVQYSSAGAAAHQKLIDDFAWTISDGGQLEAP